MKCLLAVLLSFVGGSQDGSKAAREALDTWLDKRFENAPIEPLLKSLADAKLDPAAVEKLLREGRAVYADAPQPAGKLTGDVKLDCDHVDHSVKYFIYVPKAYEPKKAWPLVIVGHGGSSARDLAFGARAALGGMNPFWFEAAEAGGLLIVAPLSDRGWGSIGNSILFSAISKVSRDYHVDPDRLYITGHSMGGHLTWRSGISLADRWGAISPMSGGYDYVKDKQVFNLYNVPGFATWGAQEPYQINEFNRTIKTWMADHAFPWTNTECAGGHQIFPAEVPKVAKFFLDNPRNLYRDKVYGRAGGPLEFNTPDKNAQWNKEHAWTKGRPIPASTFHWVRFVPLPAETAVDKSLQQAWAVNQGGNRFELTTSNVRTMKLYLHPRMVDFAKNVVVMVNGKKLVDKKVSPDLKTMLQLVREFDDRGRIFHAVVELEIADDGEVPEPTYKGR